MVSLRNDREPVVVDIVVQPPALLALHSASDHEVRHETDACGARPDRCRAGTASNPARSGRAARGPWWPLASAAHRLRRCPYSPIGCASAIPIVVEDHLLLRGDAPFVRHAGSFGTRRAPPRGAGSEPCVPSAARNTSASSSEFDASRFAPCDSRARHLAAGRRAPGSPCVRPGRSPPRHRCNGRRGTTGSARETRRSRIRAPARDVGKRLRKSPSEPCQVQEHEFAPRRFISESIALGHDIAGRQISSLW